MRKGKSIIGKDILSLDEGRKLDKVTDVVVDRVGRNVVALVVNEGGFMSSSKVVPIDEVSSFGKDAVVIASRNSIVSVSDQPRLRALVEHDEKIIGKKVFTTSGDDQGSISDIYFDEASGEVRGYEVSAGLLGNAASGTSYLATDEIAGIGTDVIYVEPQTAQALEQQVGGIRGALEGAGDKLGEAREQATQKVREQQAGGGRRGATDGPRPEESLVGKRAGSDVEADNGSVLVAKGRRIRDEDVVAAKNAGKLPALTASVALGGAQDAGADAKDAVGAAGDRAGSLWDQFTAKIGEMTDATGKRVDEQQTKQRLATIADAVGRPVTKVILDREDNVILNLGDIITHQSVQRAHEAGGLDSLLDSAYKGQVEFTKDEMRAPAEAEATVDRASGGAVIVDELETKVADAERERDEEKERKKREADGQRGQRERERQARETQRQTDKRSRELETGDPVMATEGQPLPRRAVRESSGTR